MNPLTRFVSLQVDDMADRGILRIALVDIRHNDVLDCDMVDRDKVYDERSTIDRLREAVERFKSSLKAHGVL